MTREDLSETVSQVSVTPPHPVPHSGAKNVNDFPPRNAYARR